MKTIASYLLMASLAAVGLCTLPGVAHARTVTETWNIEGIHSAADVKQVRSAIEHVTGISVDEVTQADVAIRFDDRKLTETQVRKQLVGALAQVSTRQHAFHLMQKAD